MKTIKGILDKKTIKSLKAGEEILYTGFFYTARDQAHKKMSELIKKGRKLPFDIKNAIIYYVGPTPSKQKNRVGSAGPTTSLRMDAFTPGLLDKGLSAMVGKGSRTHAVIKSVKKNKAVYFVTMAGAGAYLSKRIKKAEVIAFDELGTESIRKLEVEDFPLIVAIDSKGKSIYK